MNWMTSAKKRVYRKKRKAGGSVGAFSSSDDGLRYQAHQKYEANQKDAMTLLQTLQFGKSQVYRSKQLTEKLSNEERETKRHIPPDLLLLRDLSRESIDNRKFTNVTLDAQSSEEISLRQPDPLQHLLLSPTNREESDSLRFVSSTEDLRPVASPTQKVTSSSLHNPDGILFFENGDLLCGSNTKQSPVELVTKPSISRDEIIDIQLHPHSRDYSGDDAESRRINYEDFLKSWDLFDGESSFLYHDGRLLNNSPQQIERKKSQSCKRKFISHYETELEELKLHQKTIDSADETNYLNVEGDELLLSLDDLL